MTPGDRFVGYMEDFGRGVLGFLQILLIVAWNWGTPLGVIFAVVYLAVSVAD